jgi:hypothetical protein
MDRKTLWKLHLETLGLQPRFDMAPVQLGMRRNPWRILVCCVMLHRTGIHQARPVLRELLRRRWPTAAELATSGPDLEMYIRPCGLVERRARMLRDLSREFVLGNWERASELPGVGEYGVSALRIFCLGDLKSGSCDGALDAYCTGASEPIRRAVVAGDRVRLPESWSEGFPEERGVVVEPADSFGWIIVRVDRRLGEGDDGLRAVERCELILEEAYHAAKA